MVWREFVRIVVVPIAGAAAIALLDREAVTAAEVDWLQVAVRPVVTAVAERVTPRRPIQVPSLSSARRTRILHAASLVLVSLAIRWKLFSSK
jgi:hypothetical protein